jgi:predicted HicB family RNase H-like nuclease
MSGLKNFSIRLPKEIWTFLRNESTEQEISMNNIIVNCIEKLKKKRERELTKSNTIVE